MKRYQRADRIGSTYFVKHNDRVIDVIVGLGMCGSNKEAKRLIVGGGVYMNGNRVTDPMDKIKGGEISVGSGEGLVASGLAAKRYFIHIE